MPFFNGKNAYAFSQNMIAVTIPFNKHKQIKNEPINEPTNEPINEPTNEPINLTKSTINVLQFIQSCLDATIDEIAEAVGVSRETVKRALKVLKDNGYIVRVGSNKTRHWEIKH